MVELKRTPLYEMHKQAGGKLVPFGGWEMPVQYTGIIDEHNTVRNAAGLFDVSHMGEIYVTGSNAFSFVQNLITNDLSKIVDGQCLYSPICYEHGGIVDDLLVYKFGQEKFLIVVNASNIEKDFQWMQQHSKDANIQNHSESIAELAFQGPKAQEVLQKLTSFNLADIGFFKFADIEIAETECLVSRTGYTGEDGFEIYCPNKVAEKLWTSILDTGKEFGAKPIGLGARDSLRLEAGLMLYGNDITEKVTPFEAPLKWTVKMDTDDFIGKAALEKFERKRKLVGFELLERAVPRHDCDVYIDGKPFDKVTSGVFSPLLKKPIGLAFVPADLEKGSEIQIKIRDKLVPARTCSHRFYKRERK